MGIDFCLHFVETWPPDLWKQGEEEKSVRTQDPSPAYLAERSLHA
jgi:hypothetical protein